jgi:hypothetical protein
MKRLREVAVRMRPRTTGGSDGSGPQDPPHGSGLDGGAVPPDAPTSGAPGGRGFSDRNTDDPVPARAPFMPSSRDLAGRSAAGDRDDALPPPTRRPSVPRRQIWDIDGGGEEAEAPVSRPSHPASRPSYPVTRPRSGPPSDRPAAPASEPRLPPRSTPRSDLPPAPAAPADPVAAHPEPGLGPSDDLARRARRALAAVEAQMGERGRTSAPLMTGDPGAPETGGAKTRVLGFHAPDLATDPISAVAEKSARDLLFPAGWLVVVDGPGRGAYFPVCDSVSSIGRGTDQAICLNFGDASVSRQNHAAIAYDAEQNRFFLGHGNKSNIVRRNGMPVLSTEEIVNGDVIRIGKTSLRFVALCGPDFTWDHGAEADGNADV